MGKLDRVSFLFKIARKYRFLKNQWGLPIIGPESELYALVDIIDGAFSPRQLLIQIRIGQCLEVVDVVVQCENWKKIVYFEEHVDLFLKSCWKSLQLTSFIF